MTFSFIIFVFCVFFLSFLRCVCYMQYAYNMYNRVICKLVLNDILIYVLFYIVKRLEQRCISAI